MDLDEPCIDHGKKSRVGYASSYRNGKRYRAHVLALMDATGEAAHGRFALHSCDNPRCINPNHLRWGTNADNVRDRESRKRGKICRMPGERNPNSKLTQEQVEQIRSLYEAGNILQKTLAEMFNVSPPQICQIVNGNHWRSA